MARQCSSRFERAARQLGWTRIAGIDEAGRGALFGPVVAAAVILNPKRRIVGLDDSKKLAPDRRTELAERIREHAIAWAVAEMDAVFWRDLGMRQVHVNDGIAILELRGGTHLILLPAEGDAPSAAPLDLMVDDLAGTHARWSARGLRVSPIEHGRIHDTFTLTDPENHVVTVNSSHVVGVV